MNKTVIEVASLMFAVLLITFLYFSYRNGLSYTTGQIGDHITRLFSFDNSMPSSSGHPDSNKNDHNNQNNDSSNNNQNTNSNKNSNDKDKNEDAIVSNTINYQYKGKTVSTGHINGKSGQNVVIDDSNLPSGYHFADNKNSVTIVSNGGSHSVDVIPNVIKENDSVEFVNKDTGKQIDKILLSGDKGQTINVPAPAGYEYINPSDGTITYNGTNHIIKVISKTATSKVNYKSGNKVIKTATIKGKNGSNAKSAIDSHIPKGYHVINNSDNHNFNNNNYDINVKPNAPKKPSGPIINADISYVDNNGHTVKEITSQGVAGTSAKGIIDSNLPSGYEVSDDSDDCTLTDEGDGWDVININVDSNGNSNDNDNGGNNSNNGGSNSNGTMNRYVVTYYSDSSSLYTTEFLADSTSGLYTMISSDIPMGHVIESTVDSISIRPTDASHVYDVNVMCD